MAEKLGRRIQSRRMDTSTLKGVGTFVYSIATKRYLFLLRNNGTYAGSWGLPGGKVEPNEYLIDSLYRELQEEIGYDFTNAKTIPIEKFTSENNRFHYHTFLIPVYDEFVPLLNHEHDGFCWVKLKDHPKPLHPGVYRTIRFDAVAEKIATLEKVL